MNKFRYSVLIRTFNSERTLLLTLESLRSQTNPPSEYIFVDSGSTDGTLQLLPESSIIHSFVGEEFNYSESLNQGLKYVSTEYVLIFSSHTLLSKRNAIEFALNLLDSDERIGAAYCDFDKTGELRYSLIDKNNFDGFNGLWNTCSLIKVAPLKHRGFLPEVFAAEDQEWARWLFHCENMAIARISGAGIKHNRFCNANKHPLKKRLNEYVAIAYFSNRDLLKWDNLFNVAFRVIKPIPVRLDLIERYFNLLLFFRLLACRFGKPKCKSRYF
jgi:glycosyltransferase involved in cell wall biosynthesis